MKYITSLLVTTCFLAGMTPVQATASEYCYSKYQSSIDSANGQLGAALKRISEIEEELTALRSEKDAAATRIAEIAATDPTSPDIQKLAARIQEIDKSTAKLASEAFNLQDTVVSLKTTVPVELAGELRGCVEASRPANTLVNLTIQTLAIISTGGASLALPEKALYVDMSAVLNGYPLGGPDSTVIKARNDAAKALGINLEKDNGFIGNAVKNPLQPWKW